MHLPRRSARSIQPLPSIHTAFPLVKLHAKDSEEHAGNCLIAQIEDGIEMVPLERSNVLSAPILSPDQNDKEVLISRQSPLDKPLPKPPKSLWARLSLKQRMLAILGIQCATLMTIGLALMAVKRRSSASDLSVTAQAKGDDFPNPQAIDSMPVGRFTVPVRMAQVQSATCLALMNESIAWQCASDTMFQINILPPAENSSMTWVTLSSPLRTNGTFYHGHQAPDVQQVKMELKNSDSDGPVYRFSTTYDHVVLLREKDFTLREQPINAHPVFSNGDTLWQCTFKGTSIEGYLYMNKKTVAPVTLNSTTVSTQNPPKLPHELKLVEQRIPNGNGPYCQKVRVQDGFLARISSERMMLDLADPKAEAQATKAELAKSAKFRNRQQEPGSQFCRCQWVVQ